MIAFLQVDIVFDLTFKSTKAWTRAHYLKVGQLADLPFFILILKILNNK
jgi:hypothetical protein